MEWNKSVELQIGIQNPVHGQKSALRGSVVSANR